MERNRADFHVSDDILSVLPTDPYDQLDLARKITSMAIASRVSQLEAEADRLRKNIADKDQVIVELQGRLHELDRLFEDLDSRLRFAVEENIRLAKERDTLAISAKNLSRDLMKLEKFKRQLMLSLNEDKLYQSQGENGISIVSDATVSSLNVLSLSSSGTSIEFSETEPKNDAKGTSDKYTSIAYISPRFTPNASPRTFSSGGSPRDLSTVDSSPKYSSGAISPTKLCCSDQGLISSQDSSSRQTTTSNSPPRGLLLQARASRMDGKEFFRQARSRLSYEQFAAFLANIKELTAHRQSREETLKRAEEIFGTGNKDLYFSFQRLINCNLP